LGTLLTSFLIESGWRDNFSEIAVGRSEGHLKKRHMTCLESLYAHMTFFDFLQRWRAADITTSTRISERSSISSKSI
jgi:hypothetical protein